MMARYVTAEVVVDVLDFVRGGRSEADTIGLSGLPADVPAVSQMAYSWHDA